MLPAIVLHPLHGPYYGPYDFWKIFWLCKLFQHFIFFSPSNHDGKPNQALSNSTKAQGTLLHLYGPQKGLLAEKGTAGSHQDSNWSIPDRHLDNGQTQVYRGWWLPLLPPVNCQAQSQLQLNSTPFGAELFLFPNYLTTRRNSKFWQLLDQLGGWNLAVTQNY